MENLFVPKSMAITLKNKGFNEPCFKYFNTRNSVEHLSKDTETNNTRLSSTISHDWITLPTYQQITDWFREKHNLHFYIVPYGDMRTWSISGLEGWEFPNMARIDKQKRDDRLFYDIRQKYMDIKFNTYYEALTEAINEGLKVI